MAATVSSSYLAPGRAQSRHIPLRVTAYGTHSDGPAGEADRASRPGRWIANYQVSDWVTLLPADVLLARGYPGDVHMDFAPMTRAVRDAGYEGDVEVEIFNQQVWDADPREVAAHTAETFRLHVPL